jgi:hypothetical protein
MGATRLKGQEVTVGFASPDGDVSGLDDVLSFEAELDMEILEEKYLGQTANSFDDIYNGVSGSVELHMQNVAYFEFTTKIQDRAERRTAAGGTFTALATFNFPSGARVKLTFEDIFFGSLPLKVGSRSEYVTVTIPWKCSRMTRVL